MVRRKSEEITESTTTEPTPVVNQTDSETNEIPEDDTDEESETDDGTIKKIIYYLNKRPQKCPASEQLRVFHWTEIRPGELSHTSQGLHDLKPNGKILSVIHECRFYSLLVGEEKEYIEIIVDKDYVLNQLSEFLECYTSNKKDVEKLVSEAETITEKLRSKRIDNELVALSEKFNLSIEELKIRLERHKAANQ